MFGWTLFGAGGCGGGKGGSGVGPGGGTLDPEILSLPMIIFATGAMAQSCCLGWYVQATHEALAAQAEQHMRAEVTSRMMV